MNYVTLETLKARVQTTLSDPVLNEIIEGESAVITRTLGIEPGSPMIETFYQAGSVLFLTFKPTTVLVEDLTTSPQEVDSETYMVIGTTIVKKSPSSPWARPLQWPKIARATYAMADSPGVLAVCRGVCVDLCRLAINEMGVEQSESIGSYTHTSKDTATERRKILARLGKVKGLKPSVAR